MVPYVAERYIIAPKVDDRISKAAAMFFRAKQLEIEEGKEIQVPSTEITIKDDIILKGSKFFHVINPYIITTLTVIIFDGDTYFKIAEYFPIPCSNDENECYRLFPGIVNSDGFQIKLNLTSINNTIYHSETNTNYPSENVLLEEKFSSNQVGKMVQVVEVGNTQSTSTNEPQRNDVKFKYKVSTPTGDTYYGNTLLELAEQTERTLNQMKYLSRVGESADGWKLTKLM